ncbi:DNA phosphorothioation-associated putative methyltransferase [Sphingomonas sp.]|uniref:DNA phosphorothioation-associated putative methyltransferase n=1 Tax=Sphingomonas sp. TaxID=28214 RepID=UPI0025D07D59|nr:DNA phosphorothioation-associated putative methyltransferase [Sphingomonas sp.]
MTIQAEQVQRHRTAMVRHTLSQPMSLMVQHGVIQAGVTVFDYGCGQGDDLRALAAAGIVAAGWDPHFCADNPRRSADVVNLGFVLNVIEDVGERRHALEAAWVLTGRVLAVSTMIVGQVPTDGLRLYRDGYLTSRDTFQKYFSQPELRELISSTVGKAPVSAAPGIFFVFRESEDEEEFLLRRRIGRRASTLEYRNQRERRGRSLQPAASERIIEALEALAELTLLRGRLPAAEEVPSAVLEQLARERVSLQRALDLMLQEQLSPEQLDTAAAAMREDLLVHYALARLNRSTTAERPSSAMVRDIRVHFGSQREVMAAAMDYLLALGDENRVSAAMAQAAEQDMGRLDQKGRLLLDVRRSDELPGVLRLYLGCAAYLAGEPDSDSLVRIDSAQRNVTYLPLEDRKVRFPIANSATSVDLKRQTMRTHLVRRMLIAKSVVLKARTRAQREAETKVRKERVLADTVLMIRVD